ncbi:PD-(D/E)XK motif protein [Rossellomorea sp. LjRoot5]|uniref:PD-(D/E)XK motif protein n=1 Tax=Rossellomorea sp. LjRoot5 TaxID=3342331 RepID=UPI003ECC4089
MVFPLNPEDIWSDMENELIRTKTAEGVLERLGIWVEDVNLYLCLNANTRRRMLTFSVPVLIVPNINEIQESKGYTVEFCNSTRGNKYVDIMLTVTKFEYREIFSTLALDLMKTIEKVNKKRVAVISFVQRLNEWQQFLERKNSSVLSQEIQRGLFGELIVMKELLEENVNKNQVVDGWLGPTGANHDYSFSEVNIEVKTSLYNTTDQVKISTELQLDDTGLQNLYLYYLVLEKTPNRGITLPEVINQIRSLLHQDPTVHQQFNFKLEDFGYIDLHESIYTEQYTIRKKAIFNVEGEFPRLVPEDLRKGVLKVSYIVDLSFCTEFKVEREEVVSRLK